MRTVTFFCDCGHTIVGISFPGGAEDAPPQQLASRKSAEHIQLQVLSREPTHSPGGAPIALCETIGLAQRPEVHLMIHNPTSG